MSALADHPDLKPVLAELAKQPDASAGITEVLGVSPLEIDRITLFWPRVSARGSGDPVLVVTTREPFNEARVLKALKARPASGGDFPRDAGTGDPLFYVLERGPFEALVIGDDRTLVFLPASADGDSTMAFLSATLKKNAAGPLADAIASASKHTLAAGVHLPPLLRDSGRRVLPERVPHTALLAARTAVVTADLGKPAAMKLTLAVDDAAAARRAAPVVEDGIGVVAEKAGGLADELKESRRPFEKAAAPLVAAFATALKKASVKADGTAVVVTAEIDVVPAAAKALGELLRAGQSRTKAELRLNNLKAIGAALQNYQDANSGRFPANVSGPKGELLLSWRVRLLPSLGEEALYKQFRLDEPWDSASNKPLIEKMPKAYAAPNRVHAEGKTFYQGFVGSDSRNAPPQKGVVGRPWLWDGEKNGIRVTDATDGASYTLAVVEAGHGVTWSKPDDLPFGGPVTALGEKGWDRTPALRLDGSVVLFPTGLKPLEFWPFVTINGGEVLPDLADRGPFGGRRRLDAGKAALEKEGKLRPPEK